jgi:hypothetical protein
MTILTILIAAAAVAWTVVLPSLIVVGRLRRVRLEQSRDALRPRRFV